MKEIIIQGGKTLEGSISIGGAKNSAVALLPAIVLAEDIVELDMVPEISDIQVIFAILESLNIKITKKGPGSYVFDPREIKYAKPEQDMVSSLRASYYFIGSMISRFKSLEIGIPGGCYLGPRPIDLHIKGFESLGAKITQRNGEYHVETKELKGTNIYLDFPSVGATLNIILASVKADGVTIIENAAKEPEIVDLVLFLNAMGANIKGAGTDVIKITGVKKLGGAKHSVIPDRIEAGTYTILAALMGSRIEIQNVVPIHMESLLAKLKEVGVDIEILEESIIVRGGGRRLSPTSISARTYPGLPTDLQQPFTALLTLVPGVSTVEDTIYEARFRHCEELNKMGANIHVNGNTANVMGVQSLSGAHVEASDLRAGASLIIAGLAAEGETRVRNIEHILRGYEFIIEKLRGVGADIEINQNV